MAEIVAAVATVTAAVTGIVALVDAKTQHNTHVANGTTDVLYVEVQGPDGAKNHEINPGDVVNFGTAKGQVTVTVYFTDNRQHYQAIRELPSDISVVVKNVGGHLKIVRVKYGTLWQEDE